MAEAPAFLLLLFECIVHRIRLCRVCCRKGAAHAKALAVLRAVGADGNRSLHLHAQLFPSKVHGSQNGQEGIPFAAAGAAHGANAVQCTGGHPVAQPPGLPGQRGGLSGNGAELPGADPGPAGAPEASGPAGYCLAPAVYFPQRLFQIQRPAGVFVGG